MFRRALMTCAIAGMLTAGIGYAKIGLYIGVAPPAPVYETPPPTPGPGYVWTPGHYIWNGGSYVWTNGAWLLPPAHHHHYVAGVWVHNHHGWRYRNGHWR